MGMDLPGHWLILSFITALVFLLTIMWLELLWVINESNGFGKSWFVVFSVTGVTASATVTC